MSKYFTTLKDERNDLMKARHFQSRLLIISLLLCLFMGIIPAQAQDLVHYIELKGEITPAMMHYIIDELERAQIKQAKGIILYIDTPGGRVDSAQQIKDAMLASSIPIVAHVKRGTSAGALVAIAADKIIMTASGHFGDAEPIPYTEKNVAYVSAEFRSTAEKRNKDPLVAAGMVDKDLAIPGFPPGKLVNLTASQAEALGYADAILATKDQVLDYMGWSNASLETVEPDFKIKLAQFLTKSSVVSVLLTISMLAMVIELFTQGFGLAGTVGIIAFGLYFGGGFLAGTTQLWPVFLFVTGIILMLVEAAIPGFGIFGISGIVSFVVAVIFAAPSPVQGLTSLGIAIVLTIILTPILYKVLGDPKLFRRLVLSTSESPAEGYVGTKEYEDLLGKAGKALTALRPSGTVLIEGNRFDVITDGEFVSKDSEIEVVKVEGNRIIVVNKSD